MQHEDEPARAIVAVFLNRLGSRRHRSANPGERLVLMLALALGLLAIAGSVQATSWTWGGTNGAVFNDPNSWSSSPPTNGVPMLIGDTASFTVNGTIDLPLTNNYISNIGAIVFGAHNSSGSIVLTLDFGTNTFAAPSSITTSASGFVFGNGGTATFYISCGSVFCTNGTGNARMIVGRQNGPATLFLTNGFVAAGNLIINNNSITANGSSAVISGPNSSWSNSAACLVGSTAGSMNNSLVISNSGSMVDCGTLQLGNGGFFNSLLLDTSGRLFTENIGSIGASTGSSNNTAIVQGGALWDCGGTNLFIGNTSGQNNSLTVGSNATVSNILFATLTGAGNSLILSGGVFKVLGGITNAAGTVSGFGTIVGNVVFTGTGTLSLGAGTSVGTLTFSNNLPLVSSSTTILKLDNSQPGSNDQVNAVGGITDAGTLIVITNGIAPLNIGDQYQLFIGAQSGSFLTTNLPPIDPSKLWDTSQLASAGILGVTFKPVVPGMGVLGSQAASVGSSVSISATVTGVPAPGVYWQFNNVNVTDGPQADGSTNSGSATATLTISNAQTNESGTFCLIATNTVGAATNCMALTVSIVPVPPSISDLSDQTVIQGNNGTFSAAVSGLPMPTVQWYQGGLPISGATGVPLILTNVQFSQNESAYTLIATNVAGTATNSATLYVIITPAIQTQPQSLIVTNTQSASFTVVSTNGIPAPTYQWYFKNSTPIAGATNATYTIASASPANAGSYDVQVANAAGSVTSTNATLTIDSAMTVTLTPTNGAVNVCDDTPLFMAFSQTPFLTGTGKFTIYNVNNPGTPVDTIDTHLGLLQSRSIAGDGTFNTYPVIITGNTVAIYPHLDMLAYNQSYYVTVDAGIFSDTNGALYAGITTTNGWVFTTKPTGPANPNNVVVAADGSGDFATVQGAVDSLPGGNTTYTLVNIRNGTYTEIVDTKNKNNITFRGQDRTGTVVGYPNNYGNNGSTGTRMAFKVDANDIAIENMTVTNMTAKGGSQAEALTVYTNAKRCILNNAVVASFQDTILIDDASSQAYFYNSLIKGDTDYFWGIGNLFVTNCEIRTVNPSTSITQPRTTAGSNGFSFVNCLLTRSSAAVTNTTFARALGYCNGNAAFISCQIDSNLVGWTAADLTSCPGIPWWEYNNTDLDTGNPVSYNGIILTNGDPRLVCASSATCWLYGWVPQLAPNILTNPVSVTVTSGVSAAFTVVATGVPDPSYQWLFNATNVLAGATNATLVLSNATDGDAGAYSVIVSNGAGSVTSDSATLTVVDVPPVADFSGSPTNGVSPLIVTFADSSTGSITNRFWSFGDGGTTNTTATNVVYTYTVAGTNTVILTVSGPLGTSALTQTAYIVVLNSPQLAVNPGSLEYGAIPVGQTNSLGFSVSNTGELPLTGTVSVASPFTIDAGAAYTLAAGASTNVVIRFAPAAPGPFSAAAIFTSTGGNSTNRLSGVGFVPGDIAVVPGEIDFGQLATGAIAQASFIITNTGHAVIANGAITITGGPFTSLSGGSFSLPGFGSTNVAIRFAPISAGAFTNAVLFSTPSNGDSTNAVTGRAVLPTDTTRPQLHIVSPTDYQAFTNAHITASGTASDASGLIGVTVNGVAATLTAETNWSQSVTLSLGTNIITVIATDDANMYTATQMVHAVYNSGSGVTNRLQITTGLTVTNALLQVASNAVVVADETNTLTVVAADSSPLTYQWVFGDGANTSTGLGVVDHVYTNDCGPYNARVTVSDGQTSTNSDLTVVVACPMQVTKLQVKPDFARTNKDTCTLIASIDLTNTFIAADKSATVDVGGAQVSFILNDKGLGVNSLGTFKVKFDKRGTNWTVTVKLHKGTWRIPWIADGLVPFDVPRPGTNVTLTAVVLVDNEAFVADKTLNYTAKAGKSGTAKLTR
ncbi:MAG: pectinesterase family protein [Verrucomicrobiia bacterium]